MIIGYIRCGLDDFGGDYGEYMSLLKGNSVMSDFTSGVPGGGGTDDIGKGQVHFGIYIFFSIQLIFNLLIGRPFFGSLNYTL